MAAQFESLQVWRRACRLSINLYRLLDDCKIFSYRDQVTRSGLSIPSNIAEGYERESSAECIRFLNYAKASAGELRTQLYIGTEAGLVNKLIGEQLQEEAMDVTKMLAGLIKFRKNNL